MTKISFSVAEAAVATGLSVSHLNEAIKVGRLRAKTTTARKRDAARGGKRVILAADLEAYIDSLAWEDEPA